MRLWLLISVVACYLTSSAVADANTAESVGLKAVTESVNKFTQKFFTKVLESSDDNVVCSPLSISTILSMLYCGADGNTRREMESVLEIPQDLSRTIYGFKALIENFKKYTKVELQLANKIFIRKDFPINPTFYNLTRLGFYSDIENLDFGNPTEAVGQMNRWCEDHTNKRIKDLFKPDSVDGSTALVLANAVYFKGDWSQKFDFPTLNQTFYVNGKEAKIVPTMHVLGDFPYGELDDLDASFVELSYQDSGSDDKISMFIILPNKRDGLKDLQKQIAEINIDKLKGAAATKVYITLPRFEIENNNDLNAILESMGLREIFQNGADFSTITNAAVKVNRVVQKAFIKVTEDGSEATAASGIVIESRSFSSDRPEQFIANHPFIAYIAVPSDNAVSVFAIRFTGQKPGETTPPTTGAPSITAFRDE